MTSSALKGRVQKELIEFSIKGWVIVSGGVKFYLKNKKNMPLKSILGYLKDRSVFNMSGLCFCHYHNSSSNKGKQNTRDREE